VAAIVENKIKTRALRFYINNIRREKYNTWLKININLGSFIKSIVNQGNRIKRSRLVSALTSKINFRFK
jgi:pyocin large subunit-like protein